MNHPDWFSVAIRQGLQMLVTLSLRGTPPTEVISMTAEVWEGVIGGSQVIWERDADEPRIRTAFSRLAARVDRWPAPRNLIDEMPDRPAVPSLAPPPLTPEQIERNRRRIKELVARLARVKEP